MTELRERMAQASGRYSDEEWAALVASKDHLDQCTVTNARAMAANIMTLPEMAGAVLTLPERICIALGALRDHMPPEDVKVVQRFAESLTLSEQAA